MMDRRIARLAAAMAAALLLQGCPGPHSVASSGTQVRQGLGQSLEGGNRIAVTGHTLQLARMGGTLSEASFDRVAPLLDPYILSHAPELAPLPEAERVQGLREWFRENAFRKGGDISEPVADIPAEYRLVEGIAWDAAKRRLFIGTVVDGRLAYLEGGAWHDVAIEGPRAGLFGMAIDARRRLLWIATGSVEQTAVEGERMTGAIAVSLDSLKVVRRVPLVADKPGVAGDVAVAPDGTIYLSNSVTGAIHRCRPGCETLGDLLPAGTFKSPQGLALWKGGRLAVADYSSGLWLVKTGSGKKQWLEPVVPQMLEGVDGLIKPPGTGALIAIQNGTRPRRIVRLGVEKHKRIAALEPLHVVPATAGEPTLGVLVGDDLWFVADSQWERYGAGGKLTDGQPPRPTTIRKLPVPIR